jgi:hypothetical protein
MAIHSASGGADYDCASRTDTAHGYDGDAQSDVL